MVDRCGSEIERGGRRACDARVVASNECVACGSARLAELALYLCVVWCGTVGYVVDDYCLVGKSRN